MNEEHMINPIRIPFEIPLPDGRRLARAVWCYALGGERLTMIDAGVAGCWSRVRRALDEAGLAGRSVEQLCFTHAHPDHIGAARSLLDAQPAVTFAHRNAAGWIEDTDLQKKQRPVPGFDALVEGPVHIDRMLEDGASLELGGLSLQAVETPGHAEGHLAFYMPQARSLFSGDGLPEPNAMPIYTDLAASIRSIRRMQAMDSVESLYSSWEPPIIGRPAVEVRFDAAMNWLQTVHDAVRTAIGCHDCLQSCSHLADRMHRCKQRWHPKSMRPCHSGRQKHGALTDGAGDLLETTRKVMAMLNLPASAANPLTAATVRTHLDWRSVADVAAINDER